MMHAETINRPLLVVTGSSGLIGSHLVSAMTDQYQVVGLDINPPKEKVTGLTWVECDFTDDQSMASALKQVADQFGHEIISVIHLAAYYDFSGEPSDLYQKLTVNGTRRLLRHLISFDVGQFVFSSTLLAMQPSDDGHPVSAFSPTEAEWAYPQSKLGAEKVIGEARGSIPTVILRIAGVYDEDGHSLPVAQQISRIYEKQLESYFFPGDKSCGQAFIHLDDLIACIKQVVERRIALSSYEMFVIGEEDVMSYEELQEELGTMIHGKQWPTIRIPKTAAKAGAWVKDKLAGNEEEPFIKPWMIDLADQNYPVTIRRARSKLDWEPQHTLRETLPMIVSRLLHNPARWYETNGLPVPEEIHAGHSSETGRS